MLLFNQLVWVVDNCFVDNLNWRWVITVEQVIVN